MKVQIEGNGLPAYRVWTVPEVLAGPSFYTKSSTECLDLAEEAIREYAGHCEVYLEALVAFERAMDEAREAGRAPDVTAPEVE